MSGTSRVLVLAMVVAGAATAAQPNAKVRRDFEHEKVGAPPAGFVFFEAGQAAQNRWSVQRDGPNHVLVHGEHSATGAQFSAALLDGPTTGDLAFSVKLRFGSGARTGGLVWRYRDPDNYYLVELNLGEHAIRLYRVVNGNRVRLEGENDLELDPAAWHSLRVVQRERSIRVYLSGIRVFEERDRTQATGGSIGVWSAVNATAQFDDLRFEEGAD